MCLDELDSFSIMNSIPYIPGNILCFEAIFSLKLIWPLQLSFVHSIIFQPFTFSVSVSLVFIYKVDFL